MLGSRMKSLTVGSISGRGNHVLRGPTIPVSHPGKTVPARNIRNAYAPRSRVRLQAAPVTSGTEPSGALGRPPGLPDGRCHAQTRWAPLAGRRHRTRRPSARPFRQRHFVRRKRVCLRTFFGSDRRPVPPPRRNGRPTCRSPRVQTAIASLPGSSDPWRLNCKPRPASG